jgi:metal-responsive CopG/Arc/MetJ family transcriptional regulator
MRNAQDNKSEKVGITLPISLVRQTDKTRGDIPRSTFIRKAVENYLKHSKIR